MTVMENSQIETCTNQTQEDSSDPPETDNQNENPVVQNDEQESSVINIDENQETEEENVSSDPDSTEQVDQILVPEDQVIMVAETRPMVNGIGFGPSTHVIGLEEVEVLDANSGLLGEDDAAIAATADYPVASFVVGSATTIGESITDDMDPENGPVSFAIGEPFVQEAESVKPIFLRRRAVCLLSVMLFNATLILILLSVRGARDGDEGSTVPAPPILNLADRDTIKAYILKHTNSSEEIIDDSTTNQFKALDFLSKEDIFYVDVNQELLYVQRYIEILVMLTVSGKPHLILPEYVASRTNDDFIDTMHISLTDIPTIAGSIPEEIGHLSKLRTLLLRGNGIGGSIPTAIGLLSNLVTLDLSNNRIEGTIPNDLASLTRIKTINFNDNKLTGEVPEEFQNMNILSLTLEGNDLTGNLTFLCNDSRSFENDIEVGGFAFEGFTADCIEEITCDCCTKCF